MLTNPWIIYLTRAFPYGKYLSNVGVLTQIPSPLSLFVGAFNKSKTNTTHCRWSLWGWKFHGYIARCSVLLIRTASLRLGCITLDCGKVAATLRYNDTPHVLRNCEDQFGYVFAVKWNIGALNDPRQNQLQDSFVNKSTFNLNRALFHNYSPLHK